MLSEKEKKEFSEKLKKLEQDESGLRDSIKKKQDKKDNAAQFKPLAIIYEFISMVLVMSLAGYFVATYTNTMPWTMIGFILFGFIYAYYRLYKSVT